VSHDHQAAHQVTEFTQEFWDERYRAVEGSGQLWSGRPNPQLVEQVSGLPPGDALEAGCGEGADAVWLAGRGWTVTAVDVSAVALERGAAAAAAQGEDIARRITWRREDLRSWQPERDRFGLVSAQYMHLPERGSLHRRLAAAVRPGGTLLIVAHHPDDLRANVGRTGHPDMFMSAQDMAASLDPGEWDVIVADAPGRSVPNLDGQPVTVRDTVLRAVRR